MKISTAGAICWVEPFPVDRSSGPPGLKDCGLGESLVLGDRQSRSGEQGHGCWRPVCNNGYGGSGNLLDCRISFGWMGGGCALPISKNISFAREFDAEHLVFET